MAFGDGNWPSQLADLTKTAWTGPKGECWFPYVPLTRSEYWEAEISAQWTKKELISWVLVDDAGKILSHAALVDKRGYHELGRWVSYPDSPKGAVSRLCREAMRHAEENSLGIIVETTQAHTSSQFICESLGLRFAGIGLLARIDGIEWDILYYDNMHDRPAFVPRKGILADPLGKEMLCDALRISDLVTALKMLTTDRGGGLPPSRFHVLPERYDQVREILRLNIGGMNALLDAPH